MDNDKLAEVEREISSCEKFSICDSISGGELTLSSIQPLDRRRGSRDPRIAIVTASPDFVSAKEGAYSGGTIKRIMNMFTNPKYCINLDYTVKEKDSVTSFLEDNRIYCTSAVKCHSKAQLGRDENEIIYNCRRTFLNKQLSALGNLELIVPMGIVAIASVTHKVIGSFSLDSTLGKTGTGIIHKDAYYGKRIIALPHPSGRNRSFNPPQSITYKNAKEIARQKAFKTSLLSIRQKLKEMGYPLKPLEPSCQSS